MTGAALTTLRGRPPRPVDGTRTSTGRAKPEISCHRSAGTRQSGLNPAVRVDSILQSHRGLVIGASAALPLLACYCSH